MKPWIKDLDNTDFQNSSNPYSQSYQDTLIHEIFRNIGYHNKRPYCVEFGFNSSSLKVGTGANVANLLINENWRGLLLDGEFENHEINLRKHFLTTDNICEIFKKYKVPKQPDYISIDVDSIDLWLFEQLLINYRARVFSVEYNANYSLSAAITFPNETNEHWEGDRGYGASLSALTMLANAHGYSLVWVVPFLDAFFIRTDLIDDNSGNKVFPIEKWEPYTNKAFHPPLKDKKRLNMFVDYKRFVETDGDIDASRKSAFLDSKAFLTDALDFQSLRRRGIKRAFKDVQKRVNRKIRSAIK